MRQWASPDPKKQECREKVRSARSGLRSGSDFGFLDQLPPGNPFCQDPPYRTGSIIAGTDSRRLLSFLHHPGRLNEHAAHRDNRLIAASQVFLGSGP